MSTDKKTAAALAEGKAPGAGTPTPTVVPSPDLPQLQRMVDTMQDGMVVHDASGAIVHFNAAACEILGLSPDQLVGKTSMDPSWRAIRRDGCAFPGEDHPAMRALRTGEAVRGELMGVSRLGVELRWIRINATTFEHNQEVLKPLAGVPAGRRVIAVFTDVTEMLLAQTNLDDFFNNSLDLHCVAGMDGYFKRINPSFGRVLGYTDAELLRTPFLDLVHPDDREQTVQEISSLASGSLTMDFENRYRTKSGEWRVLSWRSRPDPRSGLLYASARDVTGLRAAERSVKELMASLDRSAIVAYTDAKGIITEVNDNFCRISGYDRAELIGQTHRLINSGTHSREFFSKMWSTINSGQLWTGDIKNRAKNGREYWVRTVISPVKDMHGTITRFVAIRFEITTEKQIEEANRRIATELQEAQRTAKIGSWRFDVASGELVWSSEHYRIFEIEEPQPATELYARYRERLHPDDIPLLEDVMTRAITAGESFVYDHRVITPDGRTKFVQGIGAVQCDSLGKPWRITGTCQDVTIQVTLQRAVEAERAKALHTAKLAALGELAAGIAHEINNPLAIIDGTARILPKFIDRPQEFNARVETIRKSVERAVKIVKGLKKFSRSHERTEFKPCTLAAIAREALVLTAVKAKRIGARIDLVAASEGSIWGDEMEIEQVLINLINNAIDAVSTREDRWVRVEILEANSQVILRVIDSGPGIAKELAGRLFQPFVTTKAAGEGTGLGLSIIKGILDEHQASVEVKTDEPNTCFEVRFSRYQAHKEVA